MLFIVAAAAVLASNAGSERLVAPLDGRTMPTNAVLHDAEAEPVVHEGRPALKVRFGVTDWPNIFFRPENGVWDWSDSAGMAVDVYNPGEESVSFCVRVDNPGADGLNHCNVALGAARPGTWTTLSFGFRLDRPERFWGMRGTPTHGPLGTGSVIDPSRISGFQVFLPRPHAEHTLLISNPRLTGAAKPGEDPVPLPFVDRFGQYKHAGWPGKLRSESELANRRDREQEALEAAPALPGRDRFGGWADGPRLEATGWFRTENVDGKWWLVDPDGRLFLSVGVNCVAPGDFTFIEQREEWFDWLPEPGGEFAAALGYTSGAHSMAETIGGKGRTCSFHRVNLIRKYGADWAASARETACARLKAWGFNTIGNWSEEAVMTRERLAFTAGVNVTGDFRRIEGGEGYWARMPDVFDPRFAEAAIKSITPTAEKFASNRFCIGYFVDNELAWEQIEKGTLASPVDQPCRVELMRRLKEKYGGVSALNSAWGTNAANWDELRAPDSPNPACREDLDQWVYAFSRRYFETVKDALGRSAPRQLYLGCRFAWTHPQAVKAAAEIADALSFNLYQRRINCSDWTGDKDPGKPIIIGEFHFGALDRGMFHQGLVPTCDQNDRAASYIDYVLGVVDCPPFVGWHWFQYVDEPITGRVWDGENYNIGLVDVTDTPYPEMIAAARMAHAAMYTRRYQTSTGRVGTPMDDSNTEEDR